MIDRRSWLVVTTLLLSSMISGVVPVAKQVGAQQNATATPTNMSTCGALFNITLTGLDQRSGATVTTYSIMNTGDSPIKTIQWFYSDDQQLVSSYQPRTAIKPGYIASYDLQTLLPIAPLPDGYHGYVLVCSNGPLQGVVTKPEHRTYVPLVSKGNLP